jgi:hypothetical protein
VCVIIVGKKQLKSGVKVGAGCRSEVKVRYQAGKLLLQSHPKPGDNSASIAFARTFLQRFHVSISFRKHPKRLDREFELVVWIGYHAVDC